MKNLAGHDVSIFLFRFDILSKGIDLVLNEMIAEDVYPASRGQMEPLAHACAETLSRYKHLCAGSTIMDGNILTDECPEVMLFTGLGRHIPDAEKQRLFDDATEIALILMDVMDRRTKEMEECTYPGPEPYERPAEPLNPTDFRFEQLGLMHRNEDESVWRPSKAKQQLSPDDLPAGVIAKQSYDHRGHCIGFEDQRLGYVGRVILINQGDDQVKLEYEFSNDDPMLTNQKKTLMHEIITSVQDGFKRKRL